VTAYQAPSIEPPRPELASRLWIYTNFDCNLRCSYCLTSSSPEAPRRNLPDGAFERLIDEAEAAGIAHVYLTGGEPFLLADIVPRLDYATARMPVTVLTNGMLLKGGRLERLRTLLGRPLTLQVSLDGHAPAIHDACRGTGSWAATVAAIRTLVSEGFRVGVGATETAANSAHIAELRAFVAQLGIDDEAFFLRPLTKRGFSAEGLELRAEDIAPELTVTVDGLFWHPQSAGEAMLLSREIFPLHEALALMRASFDAMTSDGAVVGQYRCA
jgi:MoaA/NifB/PqqE/SkfB family radical SAM enzyme